MNTSDYIDFHAWNDAGGQTAGENKTFAASIVIKAGNGTFNR